MSRTALPIPGSLLSESARTRETLNDEEREAERGYPRERNKRKLHVLLDTEDLRELKRLAKRHGYATAGEYVAEVLRGYLSEWPVLRKEVERWRRRAEECEQENAAPRARGHVVPSGRIPGPWTVMSAILTE